MESQEVCGFNSLLLRSITVCRRFSSSLASIMAQCLLNTKPSLNQWWLMKRNLITWNWDETRNISKKLHGTKSYLALNVLTHWSRMSCICVKEMRHHWLRYWLGASRCQAITWANAALPPTSMEFESKSFSYRKIKLKSRLPHATMSI